MKCDEEGCHEMAMTSILKDLFGKSGAMRNLCSKHAPRYSAISADPLLGLRGHSEDIARLEAALKVVQETSIAHAGKQADRIRALEAALRKIVRDGDYTAPEGMKRIAQEALGSELETAVEREECPQCGGQGHIKVYADGVFQKAIDCGMCSAPNRGVKHGT